ncbi:MAG: hypothetical protein EBU34_05820 [Alphaproteobacteria bacterium]|nr:hypothetical protein [Alphaproteobacteria bacterium]
MQRLSLREAAQLSGANKSTILRAIQSGRLKAERTPSNEWSIEEEEVRRVYPPLSEPVASAQASDEKLIEDLPILNLSAPVAPPFAYVPVPDAVAEELKSLEERCATLEAEQVVQAKKLAEMTAQRDEWKQRCDALSATLRAPSRLPDPRKPSGGDGLVALFVSVGAFWLAVMAGAAAIVDSNENHEAPIALALAVIGTAACIYYVIRKKQTDSATIADL